MIEGRVVSGRFRRAGEGARGRFTRVALCAVLFFVTAMVPGIALAADPPHVTTEEGPDACAMCHRAHTAPGVVARSQFGSWETTGSALILAQPSNTGDAALCLTCHGVDSLGSGIDVQSDFGRSSVHSLLPQGSRYVDVPQKQCSSCHDAHGSKKRGDGTPFPGLLRAFTEQGEAFFAGEEYCATCHYDTRDAEGNRFDGLKIYKQTAHAGLPGSATGTEVTCSNCHASHGSDIAPLIRGLITPPAAPTTATVTANDRTLCYACHKEQRATWLGAATYDDETSPTVHGASTIALSVTAEYASEETTRLAGECQSCHNPMGSDDGKGAPIAKLAELEGRDLCYSCHNKENSDQHGITDMASYGVRPEAIVGEPELVVAWDPAVLPAAYGGLHVHTRAFRDVTPPYDLEGPRRYRVANGMDGRTGAMAHGDIDGLGDTELVVADPAAPVLRVFRSDPLAGLAYVSHSVETTIAFIEIGEFIHDSSGLPEVAAVSVETAGASYLRLYRLNGSAFTRVAGPTYVGDYASGLASGYLTAGAVADLVITALAGDPSGPGELRILSAAGGTLVANGPYDTRRGPRGPSIGNVWLASAEATEVVIANSGETSDTVSVFSAAGAELASYEATIGPGGAVAWDTAIADILTGTGTVEVAVALRSESSTSGVSVFRTVAGNGLVAHGVYQTGEGYATSMLEIGDIDGDGRVQLLAGNAGTLSQTPGESTSPSVQIFRANEAGDSMSIATTRWGGGTELAGGTPAVAVVDLGPVGRSRHPASAVKGAHVSTETAGFERHVECVDCHNVHAATAELAVPPFAYGAIRGTWGVDVASGTLVESVEREYEMCFKCHADPLWGGSPRDIAAELDPKNNGFHPVMKRSGAGVNSDTLVSGWTSGSQMHCVDCHGNAGGGPKGPHVSSQAPLLSRPFIGAEPAAASLLCYSCHDRNVYFLGQGDSPTLSSGSLFYDAASGELLHRKHVGSHGLGCETCHTSHGGNEHLIRDDIDWLPAKSGGACFTPCHLDSTANAYSRVEQAPVYPSTVEVLGSFDGAYTPDVGLIQGPPNGSVLTVRELAGPTQPVLRIAIGFSGVTTAPTALDIHGWYQGPGELHTVNIQAWNYVTNAFVTLGTMPVGLAPATHTYPLISPAYVSSGAALIRIDHASNGNDGHYLHLDSVSLRY